MEPFLIPPDASNDEIELRVLQGPQAGANAPLQRGNWTVLVIGGEGHGADIVLRGEPHARIRITPALPRSLLEVIEGKAELDGRTLEAGATCPWTMHMPLTVGGCVVAFGLASVAEWNRVEEEPSEDDAASQEGAEGESEEDAPTERRKVSLLVPLALTLALAGIGTLWIYGYFTPTVPDVPPVAMPLAGALRASEFASLTTASDSDGRIVVRGRLSTLAQRTKLDQWLAEHRFAALVDVQVDEALARDVTEVFRVNGLSVQATSQGAGQVVADASESNAERLSKATEAVRRDVRGLEKLVVRNHAAPPPPPAPPVMDDPNKRIASIVPGEPAYLVTADGSRYFVGSLLPSGHRITAIAGQRVTLERDGQAMNLNL